jgi:hypothetical protein
MRPDSRPVMMTIQLPTLPDEAVVEIHDFFFEILDLFETHYGGQIHRFYEHYSQKNMDQPHPGLPVDDPPF